MEEIEHIAMCNLCEDYPAWGRCYSCGDHFCRDCCHNVDGFVICIDCKEESENAN